MELRLLYVLMSMTFFCFLSVLWFFVNYVSGFFYYDDFISLFTGNSNCDGQTPQVMRIPMCDSTIVKFHFYLWSWRRIYFSLFRAGRHILRIKNRCVASPACLCRTWILVSFRLRSGVWCGEALPSSPSFIWLPRQTSKFISFGAPLLTSILSQSSFSPVASAFSCIYISSLIFMFFLALQ